MKPLTSYLNRIIRKLYYKTQISDIDRLQAIRLSQPVIFKPTADANLFIQWEKVLKLMSNKDFPDDVTRAFSQVVRQTVEQDDEFELAKIDACSASKSFGQDFDPVINGSWFNDMTQWGEGMYPVFSDYKTFGTLTEKDWRRNVTHMESDALKRDRSNVVHYEWLNRTVLCQSGGSHHTALVMAQNKAQDRDYRFKANVTRYSVDIAPLEPLLSQYYFLVTGDTAFDDFTDNEGRAGSVFSDGVASFTKSITLNTSSPNAAVLVLIKKTNLKVDEQLFEQWVDKQVKRGTIIPLASLLTSTLSYCTTPYMHEVSRIFLGDRFRRNDIELSRLQGEPTS
jgi:hypothetical protein